MTRAFRRVGDRIRMRLASAEFELLQQLHSGLEATLAQPDHDDPVIDRLFPIAVSGDDAATDGGAVRRMLRDELLESRREGLRALAAILERMEEHRGGLRTDLVDDEPQVVLGVLNDLRLAIGARIGMEYVDRAAALDEPTRTRLAIADHLGWLQEQLIGIIDPAAVEFRLDLSGDDLA